jgi:four helix bundle protein
MATFTRFEDIESWQLARKLTNCVYAFTKKYPFHQDADLKSQIKAASRSVMANIAEGFGRGGNKEFKNFLVIASGSVTEVQSDLYLALDQGYISLEEFEDAYEQARLIKAKMGALIQHIGQSEFKGIRYKT